MVSAPHPITTGGRGEDGGEGGDLIWKFAKFCGNKIFSYILAG